MDAAQKGESIWIVRGAQFLGFFQLLFADRIIELYAYIVYGELFKSIVVP
jgi:hypothetical protein